MDLNTTKLSIRKVLRREQTLNYWGIGPNAVDVGCGEIDRQLLIDSFKEVDAAMEWLLRASMYRRKIVNQRHSSAGLKWLAEKYTGKYISNGAFMAAAIILGFRYEVCDNGPSAFLNIHENFINKAWNDIRSGK